MMDFTTVDKELFEKFPYGLMTETLADETFDVDVTNDVKAFLHSQIEKALEDKARETIKECQVAIKMGILQGKDIATIVNDLSLLRGKGI